MFKCKLYKVPLLLSVTMAQLLSASLNPAVAASVNLDTPQVNSECPKSKRKSLSESGTILSQLPEGNERRPADSGCEVSGEDTCDVAGEGGCEVGGPPAQGGGILPALAAAGGAGFSPLFLAPLAALPFLGSGGGGGDSDGGGNGGTVPSTEPVPEPSTVFGSAIALGAVTAIARKRKSSRKRKIRK